MGLRSTLFGRDRQDALSVPAMDGVFKPNTALDDASCVLELPGIDDLAIARGQLCCTAGNQVLAVDPVLGTFQSIGVFEGQVTALAASPSGTLVAGVETSGLRAFDGSTWRLIDLPRDVSSCVKALAFADDDEVFAAVGSRQYPASDWKRDLMNRGSSGAVVRCRLSTGKHEIVASGLAFPYGLAATAGGGLLVSESWRHRIVSTLPGNASPRVVLPDLPAYPARLATASDGGVWLALFAPRRQLTEFVLSEDDYRREMMETIPPEAWIGPDLAANGDDRQPLQAGSVRQMGIMKPWGPSRSYGLVARLDRNLQPVASFQSRADGSRHGVTSVVEHAGHVYAASRGSGALLRLEAGTGVPT